MSEEQNILQEDKTAYWMRLRSKFWERNRNFRSRSIEGTFEKVDFSSDHSSVFLWINCEKADFPLHWHSTVEIIMPIINPYTVKLNQAEYSLKEQDIMIIPPGELHELKAPPSGIRLILLFNMADFSRFRAFSPLFSLLSRSFLITEDTMPEIYLEEQELLTKIAEEYADGGQLGEPMIMSYLIRFFVLLIRANQNCLQNDLPSSQMSKRREYAEKFNLVFDYIEHHYTEEISLESAASIIGFSKFHFSRLFHQYTDTSFYDYLCIRRLKASEVLLLNPTLSITDVALQSGFSSISTFNRVFKKFKSCTPTEFKEFYQSGRRHTKARQNSDTPLQ